MTTTATPTTIKLGDIDLGVFQLKCGSYAAPGLFRVFNTDIYRYGECWYHLGDVPPPSLGKYWGWDWDRNAFLTIMDNKLFYISVNPIDPEMDISDANVEYSWWAVPNNLEFLIDFCYTGRVLSDEVIDDLYRLLDQVRSGSYFTSLAAQSFLLRNTENDLPKPKTRGTVAKDKDVSSTPNSPRSKMPKKRTGFIYLVKLDAHLKLGFTQNINQRLDAFKTTNFRVELIKSIKGTLCQEKRLHSRLGSKVRELYEFEDEQKIVKAMDRSD
jgi:hypothetical protein